MHVLSQLTKIFLDPLTLGLLVCAGLPFISGASYWVRCISLAVPAAFLLVVFPLSSWPLVALERCFPVHEFPQEVRGIVVLGGAVDSRLSKKFQLTTLNDSADRIIAMILLRRQLPTTPIIYSSDQNEVSAIKKLISDLNIPTTTFTWEESSRNTRDHAINTLRLAEPSHGDAWALVTSAYHLSRAVSAFQAAGWPTLIPYPVDQRTSGEFSYEPWLLPADQVRKLAIAIREVGGLLGYWTRGWSARAFPCAG